MRPGRQTRLKKADEVKLASLWFTDNFLKCVGDERPQVFILDGHDSHNFIELIELAIANQVTLFLNC